MAGFDSRWGLPLRYETITNGFGQEKKTMGKREPGEKPAKIKHDKFYTRARAERELSAGADPAQTFRNDKGLTLGRFTDHPNYHVRRKAWMKMGQPLPEDPAERAKFLASIKVKEKVTLVLGAEPVLLPTDESGMVDI